MTHVYGIYVIRGTGYSVWVIQNPFAKKGYKLDDGSKTIDLINIPKRDVESELERIARKESTLRRLVVPQSSRFDKR